MRPIKVGDRVRVRLDAKQGLAEGWYTGTVFRIDAYSQHRSFYWVRFDPEESSLLGLSEISVFNPRNIQPLSDSPAS